jgi:hypothetical protein
MIGLSPLRLPFRHARIAERVYSGRNHQSQAGCEDCPQRFLAASPLMRVIAYLRMSPRNAWSIIWYPKDDHLHRCGAGAIALDDRADVSASIIRIETEAWRRRCAHCLRDLFSASVRRKKFERFASNERVRTQTASSSPAIRTLERNCHHFLTNRKGLFRSAGRGFLCPA